MAENIIDDFEPISITVSGILYENLTFYTLAGGDNYIYVDPGYNYRLYINNMPRGGGAYYIKRPYSFSVNDFDIIFKFTVQELMEPVAPDTQGGQIVMLFARSNLANALTGSSGVSGIPSPQGDGLAFYVRSYVQEAISCLDIQMRQYNNGATVANVSTLMPVNIQEVFPYNVPRWVRMTRIGNLFSIYFYADEGMTQEITTFPRRPGGLYPADSFKNIILPDTTSPYEYFVAACNRGSGDIIYRSFATMENFTING